MMVNNVIISDHCPGTYDGREPERGWHQREHGGTTPGTNGRKCQTKQVWSATILTLHAYYYVGISHYFVVLKWRCGIWRSEIWLLHNNATKYKPVLFWVIFNSNFNKFEIATTVQNLRSSRCDGNRRQAREERAEEQEVQAHRPETQGGIDWKRNCRYVHQRSRKVEYASF